MNLWGTYVGDLLLSQTVSLPYSAGHMALAFLLQLEESWHLRLNSGSSVKLQGGKEAQTLKMHILLPAGKILLNFPVCKSESTRVYTRVHTHMTKATALPFIPVLLVTPYYNC